MKAFSAVNSSSETSLPSVVHAVRGNERLIFALSLLAGLALAFSWAGLGMRASGDTMKPVVFMAGLAAAVVILFFVVQLVRARGPAPDDEPGAGLDTHQGKFADRERIFGKDVPAFLIRDVKATMPGILDEAEVAESGVTVNVETMLVAQFPGPREARRAAAAYHRAFLLQDVSGDEVQGWKARRSLQGDYVEILCRGRVLFVWSCLSPEACAELRKQCDVDSLLPCQRNCGLTK